MSDIQYYICDTETTGLSNKLHEITEFSFIRCQDKVCFTRDVKCDRPESASLDALRITNKTLNDLKSGLSKKEACEKIIKFLEMDNSNPAFRCIVGHNINFDRGFLFSMFDECGLVFPANLWMDTIPMTREMYKKGNVKSKGRLKLADACDFMQVKRIKEAHKANVDCMNTYFLWKSLMATNINHIDYIKTVAQKEENNNYDFDISDIE